MLFGWDTGLIGGVLTMNAFQYSFNLDSKSSNFANLQVVPIYISENVNREIRGQCIGCIQLFNVTGIMLSYFINYGISNYIKSPTDPAKWRIPFAL
ncbi:hypothetical protein FJTKL_06329 [Diaporthe vaccinii]|uniref:Uncharacterized protein n=1 Tax=Diaporthe vaccinii TaxID=105482 RepID=A0ABR4DQJ2_9PEZI